MMYLDDDGRYLVFASKAGADSNPDWYHNLIAHPDTSIEVGDLTTSGPVLLADCRDTRARLDRQEEEPR